MPNPSIYVQPIENHHAQLFYKDLTFDCCVGKGGVTFDKREGDHMTPIGRFPLREVYYRPDRIQSFLCPFDLIPITPDMGWCDDTDYLQYNQLVRLPFDGRHEELWRQDKVYDIVVAVGYNDNPIIPDKGSAIFMHIAKTDQEGRFLGTEGCIALKQDDLIQLLSCIDQPTDIVIGDRDLK